MATSETGTDRSRMKIVALVAGTVITIALFAAQATSLLSITADTAPRPPVRVATALPTGPQHGRGPHPQMFTLSDGIDGAAGSGSRNRS